MVYPLLFEPIYKERVWGGQKLQEVFQRNLSGEYIGESWDVCCHEQGISVISNGALAGSTVEEVIAQDPKQILGSEHMHSPKFPLLIKLLDARETLSVQVHPADEYAQEYEQGELGKCEMWYIIDAKPGAKLVMGIKEDTTKEVFQKAIEEGLVEDYLTELPVSKGDIVNIPAGMVHAIGEGILLAEIQQNSDTVYRVYDWNRLGLDGHARELHIKKAMDVIDFTGNISKEKVKGLSIIKENNIITYYIANEYFAIEKIQLAESLVEYGDGTKFSIYTVVEGNCKICTEGGDVVVEAGRSVLMPAAIKNYTLTGKGTILKSYVPTLPKDFIEPLRKAGYSLDEIYAHTAVT